MNYESRVMAGRREKAKDLTVCGLFSALIAVGAFIKIVIPVGADSMNFTLQWFFVLLAGLLLGSKRAFLSVSTYLLIGLMGIPVFARGGGPAYLLRPTFGFLLGFALAAYAMGKICEWMHSSKPGTWIFAATVGYVIYYGMGILYFYFITHWIVVTPNTVGWGAIFAVYCLPTMFPDGVCACHHGGREAAACCVADTRVMEERVPGIMPMTGPVLIYMQERPESDLLYGVFGRV